MSLLLQITMFLLRVFGAAILFFGGIFVAYAVTIRFFHDARAGLRWCAVVALWLWLSGLLFHALMAAGWFRFEVAITVVLLAVVFVRLNGFRFRDFIDAAGRIASAMKRLFFSKPVVFFLPIFLPLLFTVLRTLFMPPLGWDFFTCHGIKAGLWVQSGKYALMDAPGGWGVFRNYFGGSEILTAWAMLPFRGDLLAGFVDASAWLLLGMVLLVLGREFDINLSINISAMLYCLTLPALWLSIGSGYVEPVLNLLLLLGLLFGIRFIRKKDAAHLFLCLISLGAASGIKITAWPILFWVTIFLFCYILLQKKEKSRKIRRLLSGLAGAVLIVCPWVFWNIHQTGFPLADIPVHIFGIEFGRANEALAWYQARPGLKSYYLLDEWWGLLKAFRWPFQAAPHLDRLTLVPAVLCMITIFRLLKKQRVLGLFLTGWFVCVGVSYYHPGFSTVRLIWTSVSGRFLLPAILPLVLLGAAAVKKKSPLFPFMIGFFLTAVAVRACVLTFYGLARFEMRIIAVSWIGISIIALLFFTWKRKRILKIAVLAFLFMTAITALHEYRIRYRYEALAKSTVLHDFSRYWIQSAKKTDNPSYSFRIAVTSGPYQDLDNWFMYSFLGSRFQNSLFYIPVARNGRITPFKPDHSLKQDARFGSWFPRIRSDRIDYVMSFFPASVELEWMEAKPDSFERIEGDLKTWGLYRIRE